MTVVPLPTAAAPEPEPPPVVTKPGLYRMSEEVYHRDPVVEGSLSCSGAKLLLPPNSPATYRYRLDHPKPPTEAMELGTAAHKEVLGAGWDYAVWPGEAWSETGARQFRKQARAERRVPILAHQHAQIKEMAAAIAAHPSASLLLQAEEVYPEVSLFWRDDLDGELAEPIWRRQRCDGVRLGGRFIIAEYKTARSADPGEFAYAAGGLRYHMTAPWYCRGVTRTLGDADPLFLFIAQEKDPPYQVLICDLPAYALEAGEARNRAACLRYAECKRTGHWPGHQEAAVGDRHVVTLELRRWHL